MDGSAGGGCACEDPRWGSWPKVSPARCGGTAAAIAPPTPTTSSLDPPASAPPVEEDALPSRKSETLSEVGLLRQLPMAAEAEEQNRRRVSTLTGWQVLVLDHERILTLHAP